MQWALLVKILYTDQYQQISIYLTAVNLLLEILVKGCSAQNKG